MIHFHHHLTSFSIYIAECEIPYYPHKRQTKSFKIQNSRPKHSSSLNRCNSNEVQTHNDLLDCKQRIQIKSIRKKIELLPQRYSDPNYLPQSQILILSPGWSNADRYSCCSIRSSKNRSGQCRLHKFCPYCSYITGRDAQLQIVPVFDKGNFYFLTGSYKGSLSMPLTSSAYEWLAHWDLYKYTLNYMYESKSINGFYMTEELAVNNIYNTSVLPHIHCIIDADALDEEDVEEAVQEVKSLSEAKYEATLPIDVNILPISSQRSLMDRIGYMFKPINLVKAYERDWIACENKVKLNSNATDLVLGYSHVTNRRPKMSYKGTLNAKSKEFIGTKKKDRDQYKPLLRALQREAFENYMEADPAAN